MLRKIILSSFVTFGFLNFAMTADDNAGPGETSSTVSPPANVDGYSKAPVAASSLQKALKDYPGSPKVQPLDVTAGECPDPRKLCTPAASSTPLHVPTAPNQTAGTVAESLRKNPGVSDDGTAH